MFRIDKARTGSGNHWVENAQKNIGKSQLVPVWSQVCCPVNNHHFQVWKISEYDIIIMMLYIHLHLWYYVGVSNIDLPKYQIDFGYVAPMSSARPFLGFPHTRLWKACSPNRLTCGVSKKNILCDCKFQKHWTPGKPTTFIFRGYKL